MISRDKPACPLCRSPINSDSLIDAPADSQGSQGVEGEGATDGASNSVKILALMERLRIVEEESKQVRLGSDLNRGMGSGLSHCPDWRTWKIACHIRSTCTA